MPQDDFRSLPRSAFRSAATVTLPRRIHQKYPIRAMDRRVDRDAAVHRDGSRDPRRLRSALRRIRQRRASTHSCAKPASARRTSSGTKVARSVISRRSRPSASASTASTTTPSDTSGSRTSIPLFYPFPVKDFPRRGAMVQDFLSRFPPRASFLYEAIRYRRYPDRFRRLLRGGRQGGRRHGWPRSDLFQSDLALRARPGLCPVEEAEAARVFAAMSKRRPQRAQEVGRLHRAPDLPASGQHLTLPGELSRQHDAHRAGHDAAHDGPDRAWKRRFFRTKR